jgi:hypothetical protein
MILELVDRVDARAHKKASGPERGRMVVYDSFKSVHRLKFKLKPHAGLREVTLSYSLVSFSVKRAIGCLQQDSIIMVSMAWLQYRTMRKESKSLFLTIKKRTM